MWSQATDAVLRRMPVAEVIPCWQGRAADFGPRTGTATVTGEPARRPAALAIAFPLNQ
jgi:hypothetical protein